MTNASSGLDGEITRRPAVCAKYASGDSLWCSTAPMPPPNGMRIVIGIGVRPDDRAWCFATCETIWSNAG